jgi:ribosomal protein S18 acetylase RimI-like enzyme
MTAFPGFFLTFLGPAFLNELYSAVLDDLSGMAIVAEMEGDLVGFVIGTKQPAGLYSRLLGKRWWRFGWASLGAFVEKPAILPRLLRALRMPGQQTEVSNCGTLMSIAVAPEAQGKKVGQQLVTKFLEEAARSGLDYVDLTTDGSNNEAANRFYQKLGFQLRRTYTTPEGRAMNAYLFDFRRISEPSMLVEGEKSGFSTAASPESIG